jgi:endonuclease YncB( thermonuclease family)
MKSSISIVMLSALAVACLLALPLVATPQEGEGPALTAKCLKVVDGDTLVVRCDRNQMTVDLEGVDAPELGQPWGKEVRSFVRDMVRGRELQLEVVEQSDGHAVARVLVDGADLSELLAARGLAWATDDGELEELATKAKTSPCGLWMDPEPVPPWEFRDATA